MKIIILSVGDCSNERVQWIKNIRNLSGCSLKVSNDLSKLLIDFYDGFTLDDVKILPEDEQYSNIVFSGDFDNCAPYIKIVDTSVNVRSNEETIKLKRIAKLMIDCDLFDECYDLINKHFIQK